MRAMDYITSANICFLICDILSLMDKRPIEHGKKVAYILLKLLEAKKDLDEYEIAEYAFLGMIHDIGAYKTTKLSASDKLEYDTGTEDVTNPHSIYGGLFLDSVSPFGERAEILMYHHWPYNKLSHMGFKYDKIASYLHLAEDVEAAYERDGIKLDVHYFEPKAGQDYVADSVMLLLKCIRRDDMLIKLQKGTYLKELEDYIRDNILFTNEEKEGYMKMAMHLFSLRERSRSMEAIICTCITDEIGEELELITRDKEKLAYAAMLRDLGMLSVDIKLINAPRKLTEEEMEEVRDHMSVTREIMDRYFDVKDVVEIASAHHEALDGTGYPKGMHESQMSRSQMILQVADSATAMLSPRKHRKEFSRKEIMDIMVKQAVKKHFADDVVKGLGDRFDVLEKRIATETKEYLEMHSRINNKYKFLLESNMGREIK